MTSDSASSTVAAPSRSRSLDGLRGLAALSVLTLHYVSLFTGTTYPQYQRFDELVRALSRTPVAILWSGSRAVPLFFILSGFVLYRMLGASSMGYLSYAARRIVRLWVPYAFVVAVAALAIAAFGSRPIDGQSAWLNDLLGTELSWPLLLQHAGMLGAFDTKRLDPVIWSLVLELRLSLVFPLIYWALQRLPSPVVLLVSVSLAILGSRDASGLHASSVSLGATLICQAYFVIGAVIARHEQRLMRAYRALPRLARWAAALLAVSLYCNLFELSSTYSTMLGATWLLLIALASHDARALLTSPVAQWLGRISYSLYLCHCVILLAGVNALYPKYGFTVIAMVCVLLSFLVAAILNAYVEEPAIRWSQRVGRWIQGAQGTRSHASRHGGPN